MNLQEKQEKDVESKQENMAGYSIMMASHHARNAIKLYGGVMSENKIKGCLDTIQKIISDNEESEEIVRLLMAAYLKLNLVLTILEHSSGDAS